MASSQLLGQYRDLQIRAAEILLEKSPLTYDELQSELDIEDRSVMQAVMRGISDNGLVRSYVTGEGIRKYDTMDEEKIRHLIESD